LIDWLDAKIMI